jgi:hypothetical protein
MFEYKPERSSDILTGNELGGLSSDFEAFKADSKYVQDWKAPKRGYTNLKLKAQWKTVVPKTGPQLGDLPEVMERVIKSTWKFSEPKAGAQRGNHFIGTRGMPQTMANVYYGAQTYNPQVNPLPTGMPGPNKTAIASDWQLFKQIERTNAVTFRGDSRPPIDVIQTYDGFTPPSSRTDRYYLENNIYRDFKGYLERRYNRPLTKEDFLKAVDAALPSPEQKHLLIDYLMWRQLCDSEAMHLGRMVKDECLKSFISTSTSIDTAIYFGTRYNTVPGYVYVTLVHNGFVIPMEAQHHWVNKESEIAQFGPIPAERIVGFFRVDQWGNQNSPIFVRRSFRKREPEAFKKIFQIMSGRLPEGRGL